MKLNNLKLSSNIVSKTKHRNMYFKKRNNHLFKCKLLSRFNSKFKFHNENSIKEFNYKLPILTCVELVESANSPNKSINLNTDLENSILFNDYLLISSKTKYKYLLYTLFEQVNFDSKDNYAIIDGYLQIKNWKPVSLNSISSINQCMKAPNKEKLPTDNKEPKNQDVVNIKSDKEDKRINGENQISIMENESNRIGQIKSSINDATNENCSSPSSANSTYSNHSVTSSFNKTKKFKNKLHITVYDILSHVVSFAVIKIRVKHKSENNVKSQSCNNESIIKPKSHTRPSLAMINEKLNEINSNKISSKNEYFEEKNTENDDENKNLGINDSANESDSRDNKSSLNLTSMLYSNSQFANLLPLFNLPILSQLLSGIKNQQEQKDYTSFSEDLKTESDNHSNQQPLNLCKENSKNVNNKKINQNLMVNTNSKTHINFGLNNTSPSPSISSTSSTSSSSSYTKIQNQIKSIDSIHSLNSKSLLNDHLKTLNSNQTKINFSNTTNNRRQRERTTFDPQEEITRLLQIFEKTHHPTRFQISNICDFLNSLPCRKDKKPLEPYNIQYWFKNARAALRRKVKGDSQNQNSAFDMNTKIGNNFKDDDFVNKVLNSRPSTQSIDSKFKHDNNNFNCDQSDLNYDDSNIDEEEEEMNDDEDMNLNENFDSNNEYENSNELHNENQSGSEIGFNNSGKKHENENYEQNENSYVDDCDYQDDLSYDGEDNNQATSNNEEAQNLSTSAGSSSKVSNRGSNGSRRNRVFIDPISEVPILEHYFSIETYPDHFLIEKICENLNRGEYRYKFPKLESRNIQLWFKNHRAKLKRLKSNTPSSNLNQTQSNPVS